MQRVTLAGGIELDVLESGPHDGGALIFLHGFPESHRTWRHQVAHFSQRFRCITPDQRGYRGSSKPPDVASYTVDKLVDDVFQLADALGIDKFTLIGHDWGGVIAWSAALMDLTIHRTSPRVTRLVIANAPHPVIFQKLQWLDPAQRAASQYMRQFRDAANDPLVRDHGLGGLLMKAIKWQRPPAAMEPEERAAMLADWQDRDAAVAMVNWYRASPLAVPALDEPYALPDGWRERRLPCLSLPVLVIWGMDDPALLPGNLDGLEAFVDDLTLVRVPDCGHFTPWEEPDALNAAMEGFLR